MRVVGNCILYTFETINPDVHRMVEMCLCDVARMDALGNGAVFIGRKTQRSLGAVSAVPDKSGGRWAYKGSPSKLRSSFCLFVGNVVSVDCMMVVKEIENELLEEVEKLEWWFEQDIDDEGEEDEEDGGGDEV
ncbi:hypothetical protein Tco_0941370 [Tanacetum coccineum]|uniref:Uncharacterized protein n=1 Tax=Tanacetum coccineum TaxID=301880 RepID=A0ABQ5DQN7_9ASTR